jgi:hypothetical protein
MVHLGKTDAVRFCWLDLAATDADNAKVFYGNLSAGPLTNSRRTAAVSRVCASGTRMSARFTNCQVPFSRMEFLRTGPRMFALMMSRMPFSAP